MKYRVERALVVDGVTFNIGDWMVIDNKIYVELLDILWIDEYSAKIVTDEGEFLLDDLKSIGKYFYIRR